MKSTLGLFALACGVFTDVARGMSHDKVPNFRNGYHLAVPPEEMTTAAETIFNSTFQQLIDHDNPSLGTFSQFYYYSTEFWKGPGSPVVSSLETQMQNSPHICSFKHTDSTDW